jgi:catalase
MLEPGNGHTRASSTSPILSFKLRSPLDKTEMSLTNTKLKKGMTLLGAAATAAYFGLGALAKATLPNELYAHESWKGGSPEAELAQFMEDAIRVKSAQARVFENEERRTANGGQLRRLFHAKSHGCLTGRLTFTQEAERRRADPEGRTLQGLFAPGAEYRVIARFSNGVGWSQPDSEKDVRGLAIKVVGVRDPRTKQEINVDFLMTNNPNPFGRDQAEFVDFMDASIDGGLKLVGFLLTHPTVAVRIIEGTKPIESFASTRFWSGHAYLLGPKDAMKFNVLPLNPNKAAADRENSDSRKDPNCLKKGLKADAAGGDLKYAFNVQLEKDEDSTSIENALKEWGEEESPSIRVATLAFDRQDVDSPASRANWCEGLRFTPGHFHSSHRPLGNMGRGRVFAYRASQLSRLGESAADPVITTADLDRLGAH